MEAHGFTVYDMIVRGASVYGDAPAVIQGERTLSFREFRRRVDALAAGLAALGVGRGERICVLAQNDAAYLELYGACARQGIVAYPKQVSDFVASRIARFKRPHVVVFTDALPRGAEGAVDRKAVKGEWGNSP
jgi:fatty-acyl-CoA synthase